MSERKLAHIEIIEKLEPIPGADKVCKATILGWTCVVPINQFKVGETIVYIEEDSILPVIPYFFFMEPRRYRVKIIKLRKTISQGLVISLKDVEQIVKELNKKIDIFKFDAPCGIDLTKLLGIIKRDPQRTEEDKLTQEAQYKNPVHKYLLRFPWYRDLFKKPKSWPSWIVKTDEERIQNIPSILVKYSDELIYWTEKLDGCSASFSYKNLKILKIISRWIFTVCSRNIWQKTKHASNYWKIAEKYDLQRKLKNYNKELIIQGEIVGPRIQKNKYKLKEHKFFVFTIHDIKKNIRYGLVRTRQICKDLDLEMVPILSSKAALKESFSTIQDAVEQSKGMSVLEDINREGIVVRQYDDSEAQTGISFKVINPTFLLALDEDE